MPVFGPSAFTNAASDLVEETRRHLFSGQEEEANVLATGIAAADTALNVTLPLESIQQRGAIIAVDLEEIRCWTTDSNLTVTSCQRGVNGTVPAAHTAGAVITVRPKFSAFRILRALNQELADLSSPDNGMYQVVTADITYNPSVQGYDIPGSTTVIRVLEARFQVPGPSRNWPEVREFSLQRNMPTSTFPSGNVLDVYRRAFPGLPIHVRYAAPYGHLTGLADDVNGVTGLQATAMDIPPIGATLRLIAPREYKRNFTEAGVEPRRAEEVPAGSVMRSLLAMQQMRAQRIRAESKALNSQYPYLSAVR